MNLQIEMAHEPWLFEAGLDLSLQLDQRFAIKRKFHVLSQRDVPGLTFSSFLYFYGLIVSRFSIKSFAVCDGHGSFI